MPLTLICDYSVTTMPPLPSNPNTQNTQWGGTALYVAARYKHEDVIELLLEAKANPDQQIEV